MEQKKNNAIEKVENTVRENSKNKNSKTKTAKSNQQKNKPKSREEKRKALAGRRLEKAQIKAHKKAEKEKAKASAQRERNRLKEQRKQKKLEIKAEKQKRKDLLKKESKSQRDKRIREEKALKAENARLKRAQKEERKKKKAEYKQNRKESRKGFGGWLAAVITLGATTLALAGAFVYTLLMPSATDGVLESSYQRAYYDTVMQVDNIDLNLSKALSTNDEKALQKYLVDVAINSELAENDIGELPLQDESKFYTTKLINQIGDYAKYLNKKLIDGQSISEEEYQTLETLYEHNLALKQSLSAISEKMDEKFSFNKLAMGEEDKIVIENLNELQNLSADYPELIYDGPFSDGRDSQEIKGLKNEEVTAGYVEQKFKSIFSGYGLEEIEAVGGAEGNIPCYNVQGTNDGETLFAQFSKNEGKLIMFAYSGSCKEVKVEQDQAVEIGQNFLQGLEIENMTAVWINQANNVYTVNYAYEQNGTIVYPDLIKIRVCAETGMVIGMEAVGYYTNHVAREIESAKLTEEQAIEKVSGNIEVENSRLALVKIGENTEKLAYEFSGTYKNSTYYVYIDATNGRQIEMFKVVQGTEGELLM